MSTINCNEEMKGNAKDKNSRFEPPFNKGLRGKAQGSSMARWKVHCRDPISDNRNFSLALTADALLSEICRNRRFSEGWARNPSLDHFIEQ